MIINLGEKKSILNQFVSEIRDEQIQKDRMRFRKNLERIGEFFAFEISKTLLYQPCSVQTPLGIAEVPQLKDNVLVASIMRAGLPVHQGMLNIFDKADNAFISAYRKYHKDGTFEIDFGYISSPPTEDKVVILTDPMLATGASMVLAYKALLEKGIPKHTHIVSVIASREGLDYMDKYLHKDIENITFWTAAIDDELTVKAYIVPGLGDAGDLAYGAK